MTARGSRLSLPFDAWPPRDRERWLAALAAAAGRFSRRGYVAGLAEKSRTKFRNAYGVWLAFLEGRGQLDPDLPPAGRVTHERMDDYVGTLLTRGNRGTSVRTRLVDLKLALRVLQPEAEAEIGWITQPAGVSLCRVLDTTPRAKRPRSARDLFRWGVGLAGAAETGHPFRDALRRRDGLIIALEASRGMRTGSLHALTLGRNIFRVPGGRWRIEFAPDDLKRRRALGYPFPAVLEPLLERYLREDRPLLLRGRESDALWISLRGTPLSAEGLQQVVFDRSKREFGEEGAFRPHAFRDALATSVALEAPEHMGIAASLLGNDEKVREKHYTWARSVQAAPTYLDILREARRGSPRAPGERQPGRRGSVGNRRGVTNEGGTAALPNAPNAESPPALGRAGGLCGGSRGCYGPAQA